MLAIIHNLFSLWSGVLSTKYVCSREIQEFASTSGMDAAPAKRGNEVAGVKVLEPLGTAQNGLAERRGDVCLSKHDLPSD